MLSVLVAHSYFLNLDAKQHERAKPYPPLATIQVAALLREAGHRVSLFDSMLADGTESFTKCLQDTSADVVLFYEDNHNFLSKMCLGRMREAGCRMIAEASHGGARVLAAGSDATDAPDSYLAAGADVVLLGEALHSLVKIISRLDTDVSLIAERLVSGLKDTRVAGIPVSGHSSETFSGVLTNLNTRPAWDLVDIERYRQVWTEAHGYFSLNMAASRGCSFRCNWCAKPIWGNRYLQRDAEGVASEMLYLKDAFGADHIWFADDIFGFRANWVEEFAGQLEQGTGGMPFTIQLRADLVNERMALALARSGCAEVWIGAESGSQKILDAMNKGTSIPEIIRARRLLGEMGIRVGYFLMLGYMGEDLADIEATRELLKLTTPDDIGVSVAYPLPGTKFHTAVRAELGRTKNWNESNDLAMMFEGTYESAFYHKIRDLLHEQVDCGDTPVLQDNWRHLMSVESEYRKRIDTRETTKLASNLAT